MSWVISKHLNKGGGNNIKFRIGQFNKFSYSGFRRSKQLSLELQRSPKYKYIQNKLAICRQENVLDNTYSAIDEYTRAKRMYYSLHSSKFFKYIKQKNNTMRHTAPAWSWNPQAMGYGSSQKYHYPMYILWSKIYAREITHIIKGRCRTEKKVAKKNNWDWYNPLFSYKQAYTRKVLSIIVKNKKYYSMDKALKETLGSSLVKRVINMGL